MKLRCQPWLWWWLGPLVAILAVGNAAGQARYRRGIEQPQMFKFNITQVRAGTLVEGTTEETKFGNSSYTYNRIFAGPDMGMDFNGSIYHPKFIRFSGTMDGAFGYSEQKVDGNTTTELGYLGNFNGQMDLFSAKPLNGGIFGSYGRTYREFDFFNHVTVDTLTYGSQLNYNGLPSSPMYVYYSHIENKTDDSGTPYENYQDTVGLNVQNNRENASSTLTYTYNNYDTPTAWSNAVTLGNSSDHSVTLSDNESFGAAQQNALNSSLGYNHREAMDQTSDQFNANSTFAYEHRPNLRSSVEVNYDHYSLGGFTSDGEDASYTLTHQLYDSLSSSIYVQGSQYSSSDVQGGTTVTRFSGGLNENYQKQIPLDGRLTLANSVFVSHSEVENNGSFITVIDEPHIFSPLSPTPDSFLLQNADVVVNSIVIRGTATDPNGPYFVYTEAAGYFTTQVEGRFVRIFAQRPEIRNHPLLVSYTYATAPSGTYETISDYCSLRISLWENLWSVYVMYSTASSSGSANVATDTTESYTFGSDVNWRFLTAGAEYNIYISDQSDYNSLRLYQSAAQSFDDGSSLGLDLTQTFIEYGAGGSRQTDYRFISRYRRPIAYNLVFNVEGGVDFRSGNGFDQTQGVARSTLDYAIGDTTVGMGYDYEYSLIQNSEERQKHFFSLRMKRVF